MYRALNVINRVPLETMAGSMWTPRTETWHVRSWSRRHRIKLLESLHSKHFGPARKKLMRIGGIARHGEQKMHKIHIYTLDVHAAETSNGFCCCILQAPKRNGLPVLTSRRNASRVLEGEGGCHACASHCGRMYVDLCLVSGLLCCCYELSNSIYEPCGVTSLRETAQSCFVPSAICLPFAHQRRSLQL